MTDTSTKGLLPQLTEVLYALTESHTKLLGKVQCLRVQHAHPAPSAWNITKEPTLALTSDSAIAHVPQPIERFTSPALEALRPHPIDQAEFASVPNATAPSGSEEVPDTATRQDVEADGAESKVPPATTTAAEAEWRTEEFGSVHAPDHAATQDRLGPERSDLSGDAFDGRNYNFFDDLDARLAGLGDESPE